MQNAAMSYSQHATKNTYTNATHFVQSYAKINLTLDVLGKRSDGYHELATIMQTIDLADTLCLTTTLDGSVQMICSQPELSNEHNLAVRAAQALRQRCSLQQGVIIELHKRVPVAAGLGGGSSNAATVLLALQQWWQLPLSSADMLNIAASLGSDVPFFLQGGLVFCEGRGERLTALEPHWPASMRWLLLLKPPTSVSTATVFRNLPPGDYTDGLHSRAIRTALSNQRQLPLENLHNGLERGVLELYPEVAQARTAMLQAGAPFVRLSGSGSTLFAPFSHLEDAMQTQARLRLQGYELYLTHAVDPRHGPIHFF
jgi:4-diphosphocytidyl-2-C-methyl-D-erythritol kinase